MKISAFNKKVEEIIAILKVSTHDKKVWDKMAIVDQAYSDLYDLVREINSGGLTAD